VLLADLVKELKVKLNAVSMLKPAFKGYDYVKNQFGEDCYLFYFPHDVNDKETVIANLREELTLQADLPEDVRTAKFKEIERLQNEDFIDYYEKCQVEIVKVTPNREGALVPDANTAVRIDIPKNGVAVDLNKLGFAPNENFGYRYVINCYKEGKAIEKTERYAKDSCKDFGEYNVVYRNGLKPTNHGAGYLAVLDSFAPGYVFSGFQKSKPDEIGKIVERNDLQVQAENARRTFSTNYGGNIAGLIAKIPYLNEMGVTQLFLLPVMGGDGASYHKYWNENNYQVARGLGEMHNFETLTEQLYANGINLVMDAPMTSAGLQDVHYQYALKWGDVDNPMRNWFRMRDIDTNQIGYGIIGKNSETMRHYLVNAPHLFEEVDGVIVKKDNPDYKYNKPTYIQFYDARFMSEEAVARRELIDMYDKPVLEDNPLAVTTHDDTNIKFNFQVMEEDYQTYLRNVDKLNEINKNSEEKISLNSLEGTTYLATFTKTKPSDKAEAGVQNWDANTDMVKLRNFEAAYDYTNDRNFPVDKYGFTPFNAAVQDSNIKAAKFWARKSQFIRYNFVAKTLGDVKNADEAYAKLEQLIADKKFHPKTHIDVESLRNVDKYLYDIEIPETSTASMISKTIMDLPLLTLELSRDTLGVLSTPWFADSASNGDLIGVSRYELDKMGNPQISSFLESRYGFKKNYERVNEIFNGEIYDFTLTVLERVNDAMPSDKKLFTDDSKNELTEFGYYVVKLAGEDIAKYAFMQALAPNTPVAVNSKGQIIYDCDYSRANSSLSQLGVKGHTPRFEAELLTDTLKKNLRNIISNASDIKIVRDAILKRFVDINVNSFKYAEAIVQNSGITMDWRIDALKDMDDQDSVRNKQDTFPKTIRNLTIFWRRFKDVVERETPSAHIWDENTDFDGLNGGGGMNVEHGLLVDTGHTSQADYSFFYTPLLEILTGNPNKERQADYDNGKIKKYLYEYVNAEGVRSAKDAIYDPMKTLMSNKFPLDFSRTLYNFGGNHDKPRLAHLMSVDMRLMFSNFNEQKYDNEHRKLALQMITGASNLQELPFDVAFNFRNTEYINQNYFLGSSSYAIANGDVIRSKLYDVLQQTGYISADELGKLHRAVTSLVNGDFALEKEKRPAYVDYDSAIEEVLVLAAEKGFSINSGDLDTAKSQMFALARQAWDSKNQKFKYNDYFKASDYKNVPENIRVLANILRDAIGQKISDLNNHYANLKNNKQADSNPYENKNEILKTLDAALVDFMNKYNQEVIDAELLEHQKLLMKKQGKEAESFGVADIRESIRLVFEKAGMEDRKLEQFLLFKAIDEAAEARVLMYLRALISLPGVPTLYAGDEFGMSGYEEKTANLFHQCRNALLWSKVSGETGVEGEYKYYNEKLKKFREVMGIRKTVKALNNGTPIQLKCLQEAPEIDKNGNHFYKYGGPAEIPAILTVDSEGNVAISLFNHYGISQSKKERYSQPVKESAGENKKSETDKKEYKNEFIPHSRDVELDSIRLTPEQAIGVGGLTLVNGMILKNVLNSDGSYYKVVKDGIDYVIKCFDKLGIQQRIKINGSTSNHGVFTIFNNVKRAKVHFHGNKNREYYNKQFNIVSNPNYFVEEKQAQLGKNLSVTSQV